jgi:ATP-dependent RNA helicase SUPV3L1/SUV3
MPAQRRSPACRAARLSSPSPPNDVYTIAELIRRQRGGAAVVLGRCPRAPATPRSISTNGEVDYLVATDAIGMGLNLDVDHVAFAGSRKFDGFQFRHLTPPRWARSQAAPGATLARRHVRCDGPGQPA